MEYVYQFTSHQLVNYNLQESETKRTKRTNGHEETFNIHRKYVIFER
jgi:hypothetical protein